MQLVITDTWTLKAEDVVGDVAVVVVDAVAVVAVMERIGLQETTLRREWWIWRWIWWTSH